MKRQKKKCYKGAVRQKKNDVRDCWEANVLPSSGEQPESLELTFNNAAGRWREEDRDKTKI